MHRYYWLLIFALLSDSSAYAQTTSWQDAIRALDQDDLGKAQQIIDRATDQAKLSGEGWYYRGVIYETLLRNKIATQKASVLFQKTITAYQKALTVTKERHPQHYSFAQVNLANLWAYYLDRGRRYYRQRNFKKAIGQWEFCKKIRPQEPCIMLYQAIAAQQEEQWKVAQGYYDAYVERTKAPLPVAVMRAMADLTIDGKKNLSQGLALIQKALQEHPFNNALLADQQSFYKVLKQTEVLKNRLEAVVAQHPGSANAHYQLGYWYECHGDLQGALAQYEKAAALSPKESVILRQQGIAHYKQAVKLTQKADKMSPEDFKQHGKELCGRLAMTLQKAADLLQRAVSASPEDPVLAAHKKYLEAYLQQDGVPQVDR